jgi:hypothetical protein
MTLASATCTGAPESTVSVGVPDENCPDVAMEPDAPALVSPAAALALPEPPTEPLAELLSGLEDKRFVRAPHAAEIAATTPSESGDTRLGDRTVQSRLGLVPIMRAL